MKILSQIGDKLHGFFSNFPFPSIREPNAHSRKYCRRMGHMNGLIQGGAAILGLWLAGVVAI